MTEVLRVSTGRVDLGFLPSLGGRLWTIRVDGTELLWRDEDAWRRPEGAWINAGGTKAWPAPQSRWGGPPGPIDGAPFAVELTRHGGAQHLTLTSDPDPATGLEVERRFVLPPGDGTRFRQRTVFRNRTDHAIEWSIWEVCQVPAGPGDTVYAATSGGAPVDLGGGLPVTANGPLRHVPLHKRTGKVGFPDATGLAGFRRADGSGFDWRFDPQPGSPHPDSDSRVAVYTRAATDDDAAAYAELEAMTAITVIPPGGRIVQRLDWSIVPRPREPGSTSASRSPRRRSRSATGSSRTA